MTILETEGDLDYAFSANDNPFNHPELVQGAMRAIHGDLPGWYLTGVNVAADGLYLIYSTEHEPVQDGNEWLSGGQICPYGNFKLLFEVDHADGMPVERYEVEHRKVPQYVLEHREAPDPKAAGGDTWKVSVMRITEFIGTRKRRLLELRSDNHGQVFIPGKQYCLITEY